jgi:hypothetical protein
MKKFILKILLFASICGSLFYLVFLNADGYADGLYLKFTTPKQSSLILGSSKAAQGIQPEILNEILNRNDIYNYAFTIIHSPYGPSYYEIIKKKIDINSQNGVFILQVDPYTISSKSYDPNNSSEFREVRSAVGQIDYVNTYPNFDYLINHYPFPYIFLFKRKFGLVPSGYLHDNGWVEVNVPMDSIAVEKRTKSKTKAYQLRSKEYRFSKLRFEYLKKTVNFLKNYGEVYLVRLPVAKSMLEIENSEMPDFDLKMTEISKKYNTLYLNYKDSISMLNFVDGNHLSNKSGKEVSKWIGQSINEN